MPTVGHEYREGEGASHALAADLSSQLADATAKPMFIGENWAILRTGQVVDARNMCDRPFRPIGRNVVFEPDSFVDVVSRYSNPKTTVWADRGGDSVIAVFNDHAATLADTNAEDGTTFTTAAGHGDHSAELQLARDPDWIQWGRHDGQMLSQREFAEHIEDMAHTMVTPNAATMLEIASTLTMKQTVDGSSKVRLDNGDVEFKFVQDSKLSAGRASSVAIPSTFQFSVPLWDGTPAQTFDARLRVRPLRGDEGVSMGYRITRRAQVEREAFEAMVAELAAGMGGEPIYFGRAGR